MNKFICSCLVCPNCGDTEHRDDYTHPEDGLAYCHACAQPEPYPRMIEWYAGIGPYMDGRHPKSKKELKKWKTYDCFIVFFSDWLRIIGECTECEKYGVNLVRSPEVQRNVCQGCFMDLKGE